MKKLLFFLFISVGLNAQFNYQAIVKDSDGNPVTNNQVKFKFSLMYQSSTATPFYVEEHELVTPPDGVVNLSVGGGTVVNGTFSDIDWSQSVFMKEEIDTGSGYQDMGTRQIASVPVAEYAKRVVGLNTISSTISLDSNITSFNTTGIVSATSFKGNADELTITDSGTIVTLLDKIAQLEDKIEQLEANQLETSNTSTSSISSAFAFFEKHGGKIWAESTNTSNSHWYFQFLNPSEIVNNLFAKDYNSETGCGSTYFGENFDDNNCSGYDAVLISNSEDEIIFRIFYFDNCDPPVGGGETETIIFTVFGDKLYRTYQGSDSDADIYNLVSSVEVTDCFD